ncbi:ribonuclease t2 [Anaeramoeba ignava]|uniref:Ribonuclease t2 n=1 Tax=Anaeramoeba ignava TaxID=1746090 RepID=A0A9Q0L5K9_ANAIG|nr:ribonuclease t2 [Anaeramoeba ignava]
MKILLFSIILFLIFNFGSTADVFDYYHFKMMWPLSDCVNAPNCSVPDWYKTFSIHTFVPRTDANIPVNCTPSYPFNETEISTFKTLLSILWPDFWDFANPEDFWATNWVNHGTCALSELGTEENYFQHALILRAYTSAGDFLANANIVPSDSVAYSYHLIDIAVRAATGKLATIHCRGMGDKIILHEIGFCFDKQFNMFDCSQELRTQEGSDCPQNIYDSSIYYIQHLSS